MGFIEWTENMSVGIEEFDAHHRKLCDIINKLNDAVSEKKEDKIIKEVLAELYNYTVYHFLAEEDAMERVEYPGYPSHREEHLHLTLKTMELMDTAESSNIGSEVLEFLKNWLTHHILEVDKNYKEHFFSRRAG
ncbi:MAG: hemerythrin family protein [Nitrospirae bacterium]|nr:hemerythrin family protein [Nitrospirota bacterium]